MFACSMMDEVMEECCCDALPSGKDDIDAVSVESSEEPCCEQWVELRVDEDARQDARSVKSLEIRSDVDPPESIVESFEVQAVPQEYVALAAYQLRSVVRSSGTNIYLTTQRLRI